MEMVVLAVALWFAVSLVLGGIWAWAWAGRPGSPEVVTDLPAVELPTQRASVDQPSQRV